VLLSAGSTAHHTDQWNLTRELELELQELAGVTVIGRSGWSDVGGHNSITAAILRWA